MIPADAPKVAFAKEWYARGECPGCGAPLAKVAGRGLGHWLPGQRVTTPKGLHVTSLGEWQETFGTAGPTDTRRCPWSADDLAMLVHLGSGLVSTPFFDPGASPRTPCAPGSSIRSLYGEALK